MPAKCLYVKFHIYMNIRYLQFKINIKICIITFLGYIKKYPMVKKIQKNDTELFYENHISSFIIKQKFFYRNAP